MVKKTAAQLLKLRWPGEAEPYITHLPTPEGKEGYATSRNALVTDINTAKIACALLEFEDPLNGHGGPVRVERFREHLRRSWSMREDEVDHDIDFLLNHHYISRDARGLSPDNRLHCESGYLTRLSALFQKRNTELSPNEVGLLECIWETQHIHRHKYPAGVTSKHLAALMEVEETAMLSLLHSLGPAGWQLVASDGADPGRYRINDATAQWPPDGIVMCDLIQRSSAPPLYSEYLRELDELILPGNRNVELLRWLEDEANRYIERRSALPDRLSPTEGVARPQWPWLRALAARYTQWQASPAGEYWKPLPTK